MSENVELANLQQEIRQRYDRLSKRLKQVAKYVLDNHQSVVFDTVATIAERAEVPPSTLIRFANAFGFSGFNEMKQLFRESLMEGTVNYTERLQLSRQLDKEEPISQNGKDVLTIFSQANSHALQQMANNISLSQLESAVDILLQANNIFIIGLKRSFSIASYLNYALHHLEERSFILDGLGGMFDEQLSLIREGDAVISISFSPYAKETLEIMQATARKGIKQIAITDSQISPLLAFSDVSFVIKEAQVHGFRSQCATMTLAQTIAIALAMRKGKE
ncbi:MurR/RpiR family transcriptional regulator [Volucribacter amazonae]|uniref:Fe-S cluster assembly protein HesB n=1 Tax=Volucribacter amazonae TaxID=256731 RepID=A0A9X4PA86_9PAST|nr:MurR/RpiR family transcriptional regulator [Volucribacter amazonae]MDG6895368.1 Fe-S cluster assembly protein HesB [Volucribacter amazonae]